MPSGGVIVEPQAGQGTRSDWIVPRRVMCAFFWVGIILLFTGIILLVTSKHKAEFYQSWGAILLGLGFCLLLICFILCMHAYCVITVTEDDLHQGHTQQQPQDLARKKAPLKQPPNFKLAPKRPQTNLAERKANMSATRLATVNENHSGAVGGGSVNLRRSSSFSSKYGATAAAARVDHVRNSLTELPVATSAVSQESPIATACKESPITAVNKGSPIITATSNESPFIGVSKESPIIAAKRDVVRYLTSPPAVQFHQRLGTPNSLHTNTTSDMVSGETSQSHSDIMTSGNNSADHSHLGGNLDLIVTNSSATTNGRAGDETPVFFLNHQVSDPSGSVSNSLSNSPGDSLVSSDNNPGPIIVHNTPVYTDYHFGVRCSPTIIANVSASSTVECSVTDPVVRQSHINPVDISPADHHQINRMHYNSRELDAPQSDYSTAYKTNFSDDSYSNSVNRLFHDAPSFEDNNKQRRVIPESDSSIWEDDLQSPTTLPVNLSRTAANQDTPHVYSRPAVTARVTQLPVEARGSWLPNGAPPQLSTTVGYNRQYPIAAVHAYPLAHTSASHHFSPLNVHMEGEDTTTTAPGQGATTHHPRLGYHEGVRPLLTPIAELGHYDEHTQQLERHSKPRHADSSHLPQHRPPQLPRHLHPIQYRRLHRSLMLQRQLRLHVPGQVPGTVRSSDPGNPEPPRSNLVDMHMGGLMQASLTNSANVYLNPDQDVSDSKMSIYDNVNYIRI